MPQTRPIIIAATSDLFTQSRITELAKTSGFEANFATSQDRLMKQVVASSKLVILDLSSTDYDPISTIKAIKTDHPNVRILASYPHVRKDLETSAKSAGANFVVPNSLFLETLRRILRIDWESL